jgi:Putative auto-transporter adhesin, head GIN domain
MRNLKFLLFPFIVFTYASALSQSTTDVGHFDKVIISPHIQATLVEGDKESVTIESSTVSDAKIHIEVKNNTLRVYLDGAKEGDKNEIVRENGYKEKRPVYSGTVVKATITYKTIDVLSVRGDETQLCKSVLTGNKFILRVYGESEVVFNEVELGELRATLYGESSLEILSGSVKDQKYTSYGESKINSLGVDGNTGSITAYGEANFRMNVSDEIKITSFGESKLEYKGSPVITKGLDIGGAQITRLD